MLCVYLALLQKWIETETGHFNSRPLRMIFYRGRGHMCADLYCEEQWWIEMVNTELFSNDIGYWKKVSEDNLWDVANIQVLAWPWINEDEPPSPPPLLFTKVSVTVQGMQYPLFLSTTSRQHYENNSQQLKYQIDAARLKQSDKIASSALRDCISHFHYGLLLFYQLHERIEVVVLHALQFPCHTR